MFSLRSEKLAPILLCLAPLIYFVPATLGLIVLSPDDGVLINMPMRVTAARMILAGEFPLWDPYIFGGMPFFAATQGGVLFPTNWLFLIFSPGTAVNIAVLLAFAIAGLGAYVYARQAGANVWGAFVTGFVFQFSAFMVAPMGHISSLQAAGLMPWVLWAIDGYAADGKRSRAVLIPILIAPQVFAGHPQTFAYSTFLIGAYALVMAARRWPIDRRYLYCLPMLIAGFGLAAVQLLPTFELRDHSIRDSISYTFFTGFSMPPSFLLNFFAPFATGGGDGRFFALPYTGPTFYAEYVGYVGVIALMLAIAAPFLKRDGVTFFWTAAAVVALTLALGGYLPFCLYRLAYFVPGLNIFRVSARHLMEVDFALAVLVGRALTAVSVAPSERSRRILVGVGVAVFLVTVLAALQLPFSDARLSFNAWNIPEVWCPLALAIIGLVLVWRFAGRSRHAVPILIIFLIVDLSLWGQFAGWGSSPSAQQVFHESEVVGFLRERQNGQPLFRVLTVTPPPDAPFYLDLQPNTYMLHGVPNAAGYDAFGLRRYSSFTGGMKEWGELSEASQNLSDDRALDLLNVRYLIALRTPDGKIQSGRQLVDEKTIADHWRHTAQFGDLHVYENQRLLPRAWLAIIPMLSDDDITLDTIRTGKLTEVETWDPRETVLINSPINVLPADPDVAREVSIGQYDTHSIALKTECDAASVLVLAENFYPGWVAKVDGEEREIIRVNYNQRGIVLDPGTHNVEFVYRPASFSTGVVISLATALMLMLWWMVGLWKREPIRQT